MSLIPCDFHKFKERTTSFFLRLLGSGAGKVTDERAESKFTALPPLFTTSLERGLFPIYKCLFLQGFRIV